MAERYFIGIDGGGTRCRARLRDEAGSELGTGEGGAANIYQDYETALVSIRGASAMAMQAAGLAGMPPSQIYAGMGLAGHESSSAVERLRQSDLPFGARVILSDAHAACLGAHGGEDGGIVICGTGSAGFALAGGKQFHIGGWGFELGDGGSGAIAGREAVRRAVETIDGLATASPLTEMILQRLGRERATLAAWAKSARSSDYARFAPDVLDFAERGDPVANAIVGSMVADLTAMVRRLREMGAPKLALLGGLASRLEGAMGAFRQVLVKPQADACDGAIMAARRAAGLPMRVAP